MSRALSQISLGAAVGSLAFVVWAVVAGHSSPVVTAAMTALPMWVSAAGVWRIIGGQK